MIIIDLLERNASDFPNDIALVEINPLKKSEKYVTWKEYSLIEPSKATEYRREMTWEDFNKKSNRFANMLLSKGVITNVVPSETVTCAICLIGVGAP